MTPATLCIVTPVNGRMAIRSVTSRLKNQHFTSKERRVDSLTRLFLLRRVTAADAAPAMATATVLRHVRRQAHVLRAISPADLSNRVTVELHQPTSRPLQQVP